MNKRKCAVCGGEKTAEEFGDGIRIPLTTCLFCYKERIKQNKIDKEKGKLKSTEMNKNDM